MFLLVAGCHKPAPQPERRVVTDPKRLAALREAFVPEVYLRPEDQKAAAKLRDGYAAPIPCSKQTVESGIPVVSSLPTDQCYKMNPPERMQGLWRNDLEGLAFCAAPATECPHGKWEPNQAGVAWLEFASPLGGEKETPSGGLYTIDFVGRRTTFPGHYGEYGFYNQDVIVDRLISIKEVEPPPPGQMTKEHVAAYFKECTGGKICMPNSEAMKWRKQHSV